MRESSEGWELTTTSNGQQYFINHRKRTTSWGMRNHERIRGAPRDYYQLSPLPRDWEMRQDNSGRVYFVNHTTRASSWNDPRDISPPADLTSSVGFLLGELQEKFLSGSNLPLGLSGSSSRNQDRGSRDDAPGNSKSRNSDDKYDAELKASLKSSIIKKGPKTRWDDIAGLEEAKHALQGAVLLPLRFPEALKSKTGNRRGVLLYGPPGTGKSMLAKALAAESDCTFFSISSSDIESKWIGESQRKVKVLFELAREKRPSIIFIDEIDAVCANRERSGSSESRAGMKTELLVQMDGVGKDNTGVFVLAASNVPWTLDPAMLSRLQRKIYIPLPNSNARRQQLKRNETLPLTSGYLDFMVEETKGLSGRDIDIMLQESLEKAKTRVLKARYFRRVLSRGKYVLEPCDSRHKDSIPMSWTDVPPGMLGKLQPCDNDLLDALEIIKPTVTREDLVKYEKWTEKYGSLGT